MGAVEALVWIVGIFCVFGGWVAYLAMRYEKPEHRERGPSIRQTEHPEKVDE